MSQVDYMLEDYTISSGFTGNFASVSKKWKKQPKNVFRSKNQSVHANPNGEVKVPTRNKGSVKAKRKDQESDSFSQPKSPACTPRTPNGKGKGFTSRDQNQIQKNSSRNSLTTLSETSNSLNSEGSSRHRSIWHGQADMKEYNRFPYSSPMAPAVEAPAFDAKCASQISLPAELWKDGCERPDSSTDRPMHPSVFTLSSFSPFPLPTVYCSPPEPAAKQPLLETRHKPYQRCLSLTEISAEDSFEQCYSTEISPSCTSAQCRNKASPPAVLPYYPESPLSPVCESQVCSPVFNSSAAFKELPAGPTRVKSIKGKSARHSKSTASFSSSCLPHSTTSSVAHSARFTVVNTSVDRSSGRPIPRAFSELLGIE